ncbi:MAG: hypothetical protein A2W22_01830 [Candidatus Levybacteria bacterium RBG_16_35_11]|nr:MAG: hypothetical protein A2W22_01830 [Candidatus Levybacteria bacterium RBG_16_35_11]
MRFFNEFYHGFHKSYFLYCPIFFHWIPGKAGQYLCGAVLGLIAGMGMTITWMNALTIWEYLK